MRDAQFLNSCLIDGDVEAKNRAKHQRERALGAALVVEAALLIGLALWPMLTPGSALEEILILPRVPYQGSEAEKRPAAQQVSRVARPLQNDRVLFQPPRIPPKIEKSISVTTQNVAPPVFGESGPGDSSDTFGTPDGIGNGAAIIVPPKPRSVPRMIRRSEGVQSGMLVHRVDPRYPRLAARARISGTVELRAIIGRDGGVRSVEVLSGSPLLTRAAVAAVREWRYRPTLLNGRAVEVETCVTVRFILEP
ncbi:MAG TPA: TonB family protein [Candidatus Limnocylindrales bacterium]|nr:TonB family protein [Candidatus Limnocylindrales bacterium]